LQKISDLIEVKAEDFGQSAARDLAKPIGPYSQHPYPSLEGPWAPDLLLLFNFGYQPRSSRFLMELPAN